jgi:hypothetical protein
MSIIRLLRVYLVFIWLAAVLLRGRRWRILDIPSPFAARRQACVIRLVETVLPLQSCARVHARSA